MKSVVIIGDGMSDWPVARLGGKTPLMVAKKPSIDQISERGCMGLFKTIPDGQPLGSAVANLSVLGYDPVDTFRGRGVLEAASMGIELEPSDVAIRCNLIHLDKDRIGSHSAGHISSEDGAELIRALDRALGGGVGERPVVFHPGVGYRHLLVLKGPWASPEVSCAPPHDHVGESATDLLPRASAPSGVTTAERLLELYERALPILDAHPINMSRRTDQKETANAIWPWSPGRRPEMRTFQERFSVRGAVISAVDLVMGLGKHAGMDLVRVPGATGLWDTNYEGKAAACLDALSDHDFVYVHVEATDEAGHARDLELKIKCIEQLDHRLVRPILRGIENKGIEATVAILPDHPTPVETGSHAADPVPVAVWGSHLAADDTLRFDEGEAARGSLGILQGDGFIKKVLAVGF
jgi:2,3-bisphosphoglycerate-independent phosphoglycerate mutase